MEVRQLPLITCEGHVTRRNSPSNRLFRIPSGTLFPRFGYATRSEHRRCRHQIGRCNDTPKSPKDPRLWLQTSKPSAKRKLLGLGLPGLPFRQTLRGQSPQRSAGPGLARHRPALQVNVNHIPAASSAFETVASLPRYPIRGLMRREC